MLVRTNRGPGISTHSRGRGRAYTDAGVRVRTLPRVRGLGKFPKTMEEWEEYWETAEDLIQAERDRPAVEFMRLVYDSDAELRLLVEREIPEKELPSVTQKVVYLNQQVRDSYNKLLGKRSTISEDKMREAEEYKAHWDRVYNYAAGGLGVEIDVKGESSPWPFVALLLGGVIALSGGKR